MPSDDDSSAEDRLIARYFGPLATAPGAFGLHDDAAIVTPPPGCDLVLTTDGGIAGVHFFPDDAAEAIGRKVLRMNLSDLAAKGAQPLGFLLSLALPASIDGPWLAAFANGLGDDARALRLSAAWRRYRSHARAAVGFDHGVRRGAARRHGAARDRQSRATASSSPAPSATPRSASCCGAIRARRSAGGCRTSAVRGAQGPLSAAATAHRARRRGPPRCRGGDGRLRRACRRPRETVPGLRRRGGSRCCARAAFGGRARRSRGAAGVAGDRAHRRRRLRDSC